jgi:hypothetical protein
LGGSYDSVTPVVCRVLAALVLPASLASADTRVWDGGGGDGKWSTPANWSDDTVPDASCVVLFDSTSSDDCLIDVNVTVDLIEIKDSYSGAITQSDGTTLTVNTEWKQDGGGFVGSGGAIVIGGPLTQKGGTFTGGSGSMTVAGELKLEEGAILDAGAMSLVVSGPLTLDMSQAGGAFRMGSATVEVSGEWKLVKGLFNGGTGTLVLLGKMTYSDGTFTGNAGTVRFAGGADQTVDLTNAIPCDVVEVDKTGGKVSFVKEGFSAALVAIAPGNTVAFSTDGVFAAEELNWRGTAASPVVVRSTSGGSKWRLDLASPQVVTYVSARDSDAMGGSSVTAWNSTDGGGNENWIFGTDFVGPELTGASPAANSPTNLVRPTVSVQVADNASGVDHGRIAMTVCGNAVVATYDPATGIASGIPSSDLLEGAAPAWVEAYDLAGNRSELAWTFTVDLTPPAPPALPVGQPASIRADTGQETVTLTASVSGDTEQVSSDAQDPLDATVSEEPDGTVLVTVGNVALLPPGGTAWVKVWAFDLAGNQSAPLEVTILANSLPVAAADSATMNEDTSAIVDVLANDSDADDDTLTMTSVSDPAAGTAHINADGTVAYSPDTDWHGTDSFTYVVDDGHGGTASGQATVTVLSVNDPPSFTAGPDQQVLEDAGPQEVISWATNIVAGPANESGQERSFIVTNDNAGLFTTAPAISPVGTLTYEPAADANGSATVMVTLKDDGLTPNGGTFLKRLEHQMEAGRDVEALLQHAFFVLPVLDENLPCVAERGALQPQGLSICLQHVHRALDGRAALVRPYDDWALKFGHDLEVSGPALDSAWILRSYLDDLSTL